jgi:hypothetical protein
MAPTPSRPVQASTQNRARLVAIAFVVLVALAYISSSPASPVLPGGVPANNGDVDPKEATGKKPSVKESRPKKDTVKKAEVDVKKPVETEAPKSDDEVREAGALSKTEIDGEPLVESPLNPAPVDEKKPQPPVAEGTPAPQPQTQAQPAPTPKPQPPPPAAPVKKDPSAPSGPNPDPKVAFATQLSAAYDAPADRLWALSGQSSMYLYASLNREIRVELMDKRMHGELRRDNLEGWKFKRQDFYIGRLILNMMPSYEWVIFIGANVYVNNYEVDLPNLLSTTAPDVTVHIQHPVDKAGYRDRIVAIRTKGRNATGIVSEWMNASPRMTLKDLAAIAGRQGQLNLIPPPGADNLPAYAVELKEECKGGKGKQKTFFATHGDRCEGLASRPFDVLQALPL